MTLVLGNFKKGGTLLDSILLSIRKMLVGDENCDSFDNDLIVHINMTLSELTQLGVGPPNGFMITGATETWDQITTDTILLGFIKTFINLKVKLVFDPSASSSVMESTKQLISEMEWRILVQAETADSSSVDPGGTTDYNELENKPSINGVVLVGDKTNEELNISSIPKDYIDSVVVASK